MDDGGRTDAWSDMLTPEWEVAREKLDWLSAPGMRQHIANLLGGDWADYIRDRHLAPLLHRIGGEGLRMLSVGCGMAQMERFGLDSGWPISHITCAERNPDLVEAAKRTLDGVKAEVACIPFDMDSPGEPLGRFDVVFFCHSIHHCSNPEGFLPFINDCLEPHGQIVAMDYLGAPRCQPAYEALPIIREIFDALPARLRRNLVTDQIDDVFQPISPFDIAAHDPTEAPRSSDIRSMVFSLFPVVETRPMGGTILRPLLTQRAGNFVSESDETILKLMRIIEAQAIATSTVPSDDLFFVLGKSDRFPSR